MAYPEIPHAAFLPGSVFADLSAPTRPRVRTWMSVSTSRGHTTGKGLSVEAVRRDVAHFREKAGGMNFIAPTGWNESLASLVPTNLREQARNAESLGHLIRL